MDNKSVHKVISCNEKSFEILNLLKSIIEISCTTCQNNENYSIFYNIPFDKRKNISNERNNYINMLSLALEKISSLQHLNSVIEEELIYYSKTPTIAADK